METMAIIFTGLLGVIGYVVQSKIARDQLTAARDHDIKMSLDEKRKDEAGILLERVRNQQASCVKITQCKIMCRTNHVVAKASQSVS